MKDMETGEITYNDHPQEVVEWNLKDDFFNIYNYYLNSPYLPYANKEMMLYPVSRVKGTTEWLPISDPVFEHAKASYDDEGNLTLILYPEENLNTTIEVEGNKYCGSTQKIKATITNTGDEQQLGLFFWIKNDPNYFENTPKKDLKYDAIAGFTALRDASHVEVVSFTPASAGTYYIWVTYDVEGKDVLAKSQVNIAASPHVVNGLAFANFEPIGLETTNILPTGEIVMEVNAPSIKLESFRITNASNTDIVNAQVAFTVWKKEGDSWIQKQGTGIQIPISLTAGQGININKWTFIQGVGQYRLEVVCNGTVTDTRYINTHEAYIVADANGKQTTVSYTTGPITTPDDATALLLKNIFNSTIEVVPNDNPNTLYYLGEIATVTGLDGKNIINDKNQATSITLQDGNNFLVASEFTAQSITYKRSFEAGWTTLMVPFETTIPEGLTAMEFVSEDGDEVTFKQVSKLLAFKPYLVKVEAAKEITFTGSDQMLWSNYTNAATASNFKFIGITSKPAYEDAYMLNADGTKFERSTNPTYQSFRGCFVPTYGGTYLPDALIIKGAPTGIESVLAPGAKTDDGYFNLAGQRVSPDFKGIVIHNGKKKFKFVKK